MSLQSKNQSNCSFVDGVEKKNDNVFLTGNKYDAYTKIKSYINEIIKTNINPVNVVSPTIFKKNNRLEELQKLFGLDIFQCSGNLILRPATDFGIFTLLENTTIKNCDLPKAYYEMGLCYRLEDEFDGSLIRSYSFELPDIHVIVKTNFYEIVKQHMVLYKQILDNFGINRATALRITEQEFTLYSDKIKEIAKDLNEDIFLNIVPSTIRYWEAKFKFVQVNKENKQIQLSTVQVDYQTSKIFNFKDEVNENVAVIHSSPGSIQRLLCCLIDKQQFEKNFKAVTNYSRRRKT